STQVNDDAASGFLDFLHRFVQLLSAVATSRMEYITSQALRVHTYWDIFCAIEFLYTTSDKRNVLLTVNLVLVSQSLTRTEISRQLGFDHSTHLGLVMAAPFNKLLNRDHLQIVLIRKPAQFFRARHGSGIIFRHNFTQHAGRTKS